MTNARTHEAVTHTHTVKLNKGVKNIDLRKDRNSMCICSIKINA